MLGWVNADNPIMCTFPLCHFIVFSDQFKQFYGELGDDVPDLVLEQIEILLQL